jgi:hypothetical protein
LKQTSCPEWRKRQPFVACPTAAGGAGGVFFTVSHPPPNASHSLADCAITGTTAEALRAAKTASIETVLMPFLHLVDAAAGRAGRND